MQKDLKFEKSSNATVSLQIVARDREVDGCEGVGRAARSHAQVLGPCVSFSLGGRAHGGEEWKSEEKFFSKEILVIEEQLGKKTQARGFHCHFI